jgi:hypothetical protein
MSRLLRRQVALPSDYGPWGFLLSAPAIGAKSPAIGYRQLAVSALFTMLFILTWR